MPNKGKSGHSGLPIALISRLPDWVVQSVLPIAIHRLLHRLYPLASQVDSRAVSFAFRRGLLGLAGQWIESVTDWAIRITDWGLFPDWVSSHARLADPIRPMPNKGKSGHSGLLIALIS